MADIEGLVTETVKELRLLLLGPQGGGKSATGNTILGRRVFDEHPMGSSGDKQCHYGKTVIDGRNIIVVDTPGLLDEVNPSEETRNKISREIAKCLLLSAPGPHAILLVIRMTRLSNRLQRATRLIESTFGPGANRCIIIILTGQDDLEHEDETLDQFITNSPPYMQDILQNYPVVSVNNRATSDNKKEQAKDIIRQVVQQNSVHMSNELFDSIEEVLSRAEAESV